MALRDILLSGSANRQTIIHFPNGEHEDIGSGIYSGSMKLNRILCNSSSLQYGECNAASFQAQIANISDLSGVKVYVYQKIDTEIIPLFTGIVGSCKAVRNKSYRKLVAYDEIYSVSSRNIVNWYNDLFEKNTSYTLKQFRDSFFSHIGIEQENTELINDAVIIEKTIQTDSLKAGDVMYAICQINACFGNMTPEGKFRYVDLDAGETYDVSDNLKNTTSYEEYVTKTIDKLMILSNEDELNVSIGSGDNTYTIKGNFLIYGYETETLRTVAGRIFQKIRYMSYRPADIKTILSEINIQLGDKIIVTDNNIGFTTYALKESFSGAQLLTQTIRAEGEEEYADVINDVNGDIRELKLKQSTILSALQTEYLKAETAELTYIKSTELTTIEADIKNAVIGSLSTEFATVNYLETNYAQINLANVEKSTIGTVLADVGLITEATIVNGHVTGYLDSVNINANSITAGDLSVERLIMRGSENSIVYALNNITGALQAQNVDTINGEVLTQRTVTADRLVAKSITANEIAASTISVNELNVSNIFGNEAVLNKLTTSSVFSNAVAANSVVVGASENATTALSTANSVKATADAVTKWCYNNNMTYINGGKIYTGTVTANAIASNAITATKIAANAVTADKLNVSSLSAITANLGTVTAGIINMNNVNGGTAYITYKDTGGYYNNIGSYGMDLAAERRTTYVRPGYIYMQLNDSEAAITMARYATDYATDIAPGWGIFSHRLSVGGYNNTSYALSTASFICNSWVRTVGNTGWFNETYGGGWYMSDTTWIRAYNNKSIYTGGTIQGGTVKTSGGVNLATVNSNLGGMQFSYLSITSPSATGSYVHIANVPNYGNVFSAVIQRSDNSAWQHVTSEVTFYILSGKLYGYVSNSFWCSRPLRVTVANHA